MFCPGQTASFARGFEMHTELSRASVKDCVQKVVGCDKQRRLHRVFVHELVCQTDTKLGGFLLNCGVLVISGLFPGVAFMCTALSLC